MERGGGGGGRGRGETSRARFAAGDANRLGFWHWRNNIWPKATGFFSLPIYFGGGEERGGGKGKSKAKLILNINRSS